MSFISSLFGSDKVIDAVINGLDAIVFTDEERSNAKMAFLKLYEPFKLAQRYIAMTFCPAYMLGWVLTFVIEIIDIFTVKNLDTQSLYNLLQGDVSLMVTIILGFYFGGGAVEGVVGMLGKKK